MKHKLADNSTLVLSFVMHIVQLCRQQQCCRMSLEEFVIDIYFFILALLSLNWICNETMNNKITTSRMFEGVYVCTG